MAQPREAPLTPRDTMKRKRSRRAFAVAVAVAFAFRAGRPLTQGRPEPRRQPPGCRPRKPKATVGGRSGERGRAGRREPSSSTARPKRDEAQRRRASAGPRGPRFGSVARRAGVSRAALQTALPRRTLRSYPTAGSGGVDRPRASTRRGRSPPPGGAGREPPAALWPGTQRARSAGGPGQRPTAYRSLWFGLVYLWSFGGASVRHDRWVFRTAAHKAGPRGARTCDRGGSRPRADGGCSIADGQYFHGEALGHQYFVHRVE